MSPRFDPASVSYRGAAPADLEDILALVRRCELLEPGVTEALGSFTVAAAQRRLIGMCGLEAHDTVGLLRTLGVEPEYRRLGLGRQLVEATLARGRAAGLATTYLLTTTARNFFSNLGFEPVARDLAPLPIRESWEFKAGCPSSATLMRRAT